MINPKHTPELKLHFNDLEEKTYKELMGDIPDDHPSFIKENVNKNRYLTVAPAIETLITKPVYVNANFITIDQKKYIATQAPLPHTISDFYEMIYAYSSRIVMLTKIMEENKRFNPTKIRQKADQYWPEAGEIQEYGRFYVFNRAQKILVAEINKKQLFMAPKDMFASPDEFKMYCMRVGEKHGVIKSNTVDIRQEFERMSSPQPSSQQTQQRALLASPLSEKMPTLDIPVADQYLESVKSWRSPKQEVEQPMLDSDKCACIKQVVHFEYDSWLDTLRPSNIQSFHLLITLAMENLSEPLTVHCSAGVGRTGMFIGCCSYYLQKKVLSKLIKSSLSSDRSISSGTSSKFSVENVLDEWQRRCDSQIRKELILDVDKLVFSMRKQRDWQCVQTMDQYQGMFEYIFYLYAWRQAGGK
ncbi:Protein_tyrosine phosphatase [Hexamita inflata]|uniref:Protein tyrosine phosphatase n=1 Tax=Hexamita inflata TaxID=28002 RepID=A0AA86R0J8_9EUKA|nr:Protein tyrosine phosphatase [Hexamita inflata]